MYAAPILWSAQNVWLCQKKEEEKEKKKALA